MTDMTMAMNNTDSVTLDDIEEPSEEDLDLIELEEDELYDDDDDDFGNFYTGLEYDDVD